MEEENKKKTFSVQSLMGRAGRIILITIAVSLAVILIIVGVLLLWSPGKPKPFLGEDGQVLKGSISENSGIFLPSWKCPEYTLSEKINIWRGKWSPHSTSLWNGMLAEDLTAKVTKLVIPVYFFHGIYDYTCSYSLAQDYFVQLQAPLKGFYTFAQSAHSPLFEEPEKMQHILQADVLAGENSLADTE